LKTSCQFLVNDGCSRVHFKVAKTLRQILWNGLSLFNGVDFLSCHLFLCMVAHRVTSLVRNLPARDQNVAKMGLSPRTATVGWHHLLANSQFRRFKFHPKHSSGSNAHFSPKKDDTMKPYTWMPTS
jgi:hypothetical protein